MQNCLKAHAPLLMAELKDVGETNRAMFQEIENYVADLGYQLYEIRKYSLRRCKTLSDTTKRNFFLVKEGSRAFSRILPLLK